MHYKNNKKILFFHKNAFSNAFLLYILLFFLTELFLYADEPKVISTIDIKKDVENIIKREKIVKIALNFLGKKYVYGGRKNDSGFDCSGFTQYVYNRVKIKIPRTVLDQYKFAIKTSIILQKGDLVFFTIKFNGIPDHVGIYIGNSQFIHSPSSSKYVRIDSMKKRYWKLRFLSGGKYIY